MKIKLSIMVVSIFILLSNLNIKAQNEKCVHFKYPITNKDKEWRNYKNAKERIKALQIPSEILTDIPTIELLDICLDFPYLTDILYFDDLQKGYESIIKKFNGFQELVSRNDLTNVLIDRSQIFFEDKLKINKLNRSEKWYLSIKSIMIELMLVQQSFMDNYTEEEKQTICKSLNSNSLFRARYLNSIDKKTSDYPLFRFNEKYGISVDEMTKGTSLLYEPINTVFTPLNTQVPYAMIYTGQDIVEYDEWLEDLQNNYPDVEIVGPPTMTYNCHGYAWHVSEGGSNIWLDYYGNGWYWRDSSYVEVPESLATKVAYDYNADHSAIIYDANRYKSKWGSKFLVIHDPDDVPYTPT